MQSNYYTVITCLFTRALTEEEPTYYEEAKGHLKWEAAMREEIEAL